MQKTVVIDYLAESAHQYRHGWAVVVVDVIRATTTAITAVATGRRCYPAPSVEAALGIASKMKEPLLAGEFQGDVPGSFELDNSPAQLVGRTDTHRPLVLVSSSGTKAIHEASRCDALYLSCFRSYSALPDHLANCHDRVAVIGAGSKGEFREEDQICCAWIAAALTERGYLARSAQTVEVVERWRNAPPTACLGSRSVDFLKRTGRLSDLDFILGHIDDLQQIFEVRSGEVKTIAAPARAHRRHLRRSHVR
jgi:2-phosphosulfolactate phosphatase